MSTGREGPPERAPYAVAARELLRETLLDAARDELQHRSWGEVTMADVAKLAGVSRQTLYNEFGTRDEFVQELVLREADRFLVEVEEAIRREAPDTDASLTAALTVFLSSAEENPLIRAIVSGEGDDLLPFITTQGNPTITFAVGRLSAVLLESWPQIGEDQAARAAGALVRLALSYAALPMGTLEETVTAIATVLAPYLELITSR